MFMFLKKKTDSSEKKATRKEPSVKTAAMQRPGLYVLSIIILVVVVVAFILGPVLGGTIGNNSLVFGTYRGSKIEYAAGTYFARVYESQYQQAQEEAQQSGRNLGIQDIYSSMKDAFDAAVFRLGLLHLAEETGMHASVEEVTDTFTNAPRFRDDGGNFSAEYLRRALASEPGLQEETFKDILAEKVHDDIVANSSLSEAEIQFISDIGNDRRIFEIVSFSFTDYPNSELEKYLAENTSLFQSKELSSITLNSPDEAAQILSRLNNRESNFEDLAGSSSTDIYASAGGARETVWYYDIRRDFADEQAVDILFALEEGEISDIFQIRNEKYTIYRADSATMQADFADPELVNQVRNYTLSFDRGRISDYFRIQAERFILLAEETDWTSAAASSNIPSTTTDAISVNYGDIPVFPTLESASSGLLAGTSTRQSLFTGLFSLNVGELTDAIELQESIVVVRYKEAAAPNEENTFHQLYIPYLAQDYLLAEMQRTFSSPENLRDDFDTTFQREIFIQE